MLALAEQGDLRPEASIPTGIAVRRLHSQRLLKAAFNDPAEVVRWFGAVQAQEFVPSLWALANRLPPLTEAAVEAAIAERSILRTWPMRGTVHSIPSEDTRWMVDLMASRAAKRFYSTYARLGLDDAIFTRARRLFEQALSAGEPVTRLDLYAMLRKNGIDTAKMRGVFIAGKLAHDGLIASGPRIGKQATFVWLEAWAPDQRRLARDEALVEIARRYFRSHGPATLKDFAWWTGLTMADGRRALAELGEEFAAETRDGVTYYWQEADFKLPAAPLVRLLPPFDEYLVAYKDRSASLNPPPDVQWPGFDALGSYIVVIDGQVCGYWLPTRKPDVVQISLTAFRRLTDEEDAALGAALADYGAYLGLAVERV